MKKKKKVPKTGLIFFTQTHTHTQTYMYVYGKKHVLHISLWDSLFQAYEE